MIACEREQRDLHRSGATAHKVVVPLGFSAARARFDNGQNCGGFRARVLISFSEFRLSVVESAHGQRRLEALCRRTIFALFVIMHFVILCSPHSTPSEHFAPGAPAQELILTGSMRAN